MGIEILKDNTWTEIDYARVKKTDGSHLIEEIEADNGGWKVLYSNIPKFIGLFTSTPPAQWQICNGSNGTPDLNDLYPMGASVQGASTGSHTHIHDHLPFSTGGASAAYGAGIWAGGSCTGGHTHTASHTHSSVDHQPPYYTMIPAVRTTVTSLPAGLLFFWDGTSVPSGFTYWSTIANKFLKFSTSSSGITGGGTHTHSFTGNTGTTSPVTVNSGVGSTPICNVAHAHTMTHSHTAYTNLPSYIGLVPITNNNVVTDLSSLPSGIIAIFLGASPAENWEVYNVALNKLIRCQATKDTIGGGSATHSHSSQAFSTTSNGGSSLGTDAGSVCAYTSHYHGFTHGHTDAQPILPKYIPLMFCKKTI